MRFSKPKVSIGMIWLGPLKERAEVLSAVKHLSAVKALNEFQADLKQRRLSWPMQLDSSFQNIADNVEHKLDHRQLMALPDQIDDLVRRSSYDPEHTDLFLSALAAGGEVYIWMTMNCSDRVRSGYEEGWCVALNGQIAASICYTN